MHGPFFLRPFPHMVSLKLTFIPGLCLLLFVACSEPVVHDDITKAADAFQEYKGANGPILHVLGTLQDGGAPHMGCDRPCCRNLFLRPASDRKVVSLGIADANDDSGELALFEATPDVASQLHALQESSGIRGVLPAIFLTHAHIGHYSGLMYLGREVLGASGVQVHAMPRFCSFLQNNGPWDQLISLGNIEIVPLQEDSLVQVTKRVQTLPIRVPHRDEYSETVGYRIVGPNRSVLFIPDINKWELWERDLKQQLALVDRAYLDATFFDSSEVGHRDMSEIPHPFVVETMAFLNALDSGEKAKVHFIHMNHTNPCLSDTSKAYHHVLSSGFHVALVNDQYPL